MCFVNNEPLGKYSLTTGVTHLHRTFNSNYAFKLNDRSTEGISLHETGINSKYSNQFDNQIDPNLTFVFAKEGENIKSIERGGGFYIKNDSDQDLYSSNKLSYFNDLCWYLRDYQK
jgi:hypothetical protein